MKSLNGVKLLSSFLVGFFALTDIVRFIEDVVKVIKNNDTSLIFPILIQVLYIAGVVSVVIFYSIFTENIKKHGVFIRRNRKWMLVFGNIILFCGFLSALFFNWFTEMPDNGPRMLALIGGTLIFLSFTFNVGIKMQEEQDLTI